MTAREYFELPEPTGGFIWELHFGELVRKALPTRYIYNLKQRIAQRIRRKLSTGDWLVDIEMPYGLSPDNDVRGADVGVVLLNAWNSYPDADCFIGSPAIVVQIEIEEEAPLHLTHGAQAVWLVKPERHEIIVITASSRQSYGHGQTIPLPGKASLEVNAIFPV